MAVSISALATVALLRSQGNQVQLMLVDRDGHKTPAGSLPPTTFAPRVAADGKNVAYDANGILWIAASLKPEISSPSDVGQLSHVVPERGTAVVHAARLTDYYSIWTYSLKDRQAAPLMDTPGVSQHSSRFSPDGKEIFFDNARRHYALMPDGKRFLMMFPL